MQTAMAAVPNSVRDELNSQPEMVIGFMGDGTVRRFATRTEAPEDATLFDSKEDAARLSHEDLDRITQRILKAQIPASKNKLEALDRAWTAMLAASAQKLAVVSTARKSGVRASKTKFELLYDFDAPDEVAETKFKELPPQAQVCLQIMAQGGKKEYTEIELRQLVDQKGKDLQTVQPPWRIFQYYKRRLSEEQLIKAA